MEISRIKKNAEQFAAVSLLVFCVGCMPNGPAGLNVRLADKSVDVGDEVEVTIRVNGLSADTLRSLSGFDFNVLYDPAFLQFTASSFVDPPSEGNALELEEVDAMPFTGVVTDLGGGVLDVVGVSGNSAAVLDELQPDSFQFVSLTFTALAATESTDVEVDLSDDDRLVVDSAASVLDVPFPAPSVSVTIR